MKDGTSTAKWGIMKLEPYHHLTATPAPITSGAELQLINAGGEVPLGFVNCNPATHSGKCTLGGAPSPHEDSAPTLHGFGGELKGFTCFTVKMRGQYMKCDLADCTLSATGHPFVALPGVAAISID